MGRRWRLLLHRPASGWWNMATDEVLLAAASQGGAPALRLYGWRGPWLSLGHAQPLAPERAAACEAAGVRVLRRVTGGRAVLHGRDLTYALAAPSLLLPAGLVGSYRLVSDAILTALGVLGIEAERAPRTVSAPRTAGFDCFATPAPQEVCAGRLKLAGSAQRRTESALLQHGSIRLAPDPPKAAAAAGVGQGATSLAELGVPDPHGQRLRRALARALAEALDAELEPSDLGPAERQAVRKRARTLRRAPLSRRFPTRISVSRGPGDGRYD